MQVLAYAWFYKSLKNLAFVCTYTFRMKSMESFINETPENLFLESICCLRSFNLKLIFFVPI